MELITATIQIPKEMLPYVDVADQKRLLERNAMMLYPMIRNQIISHGRAAEILGIHKLDLIEFYNSVGLPYLNQSREELLEDIAAYKEFMGEKK